MGEPDRALYARGYRTVCGVDEVGRGALAGPVVAAAVVLPPDCLIEGLDDSKKLTAGARARIASIVRAEAVAWAVGSASPEEIDSRNILRATFLAMERALAALTVRPDFLLVDGNQRLPLELPQSTLIGGDSLSAAIAAASNVAKVHRNALMEEYGRRFPGYGFECHDGYGTAAHRQALERLGPCPIHRKTFLPATGRQLSLL
ncbi:MAG: ribonuclease HII [Deltaproteobacteria bacterium]|nr:ribonuclease HII [Deltaproteobacteria bacterium]